MTNVWYLKCGLQLLGSYDKTDHCFDDPSHSTSKAEVADADADDLPNLN